MGKLSTAEVLRLRARSAVSRDPSVRRSAQDDDFVGGLEIQMVGYAENTKRSKKSQALRMTILWEFDEKHLSNLPNRVTKSVPQRQKPSSAQAIYGTAEPV